jgi:hypothetical protein
MPEEIKIFDQWSVEGIEVLDEGLKRYRVKVVR